MDKISELRCILGEYFAWNKARLDCFSRMLLALFVARTVNLSELATVMLSSTEISSRYKRLQRFFTQFEFHYDGIAKFIYNLFFSGKKIYLTIDRTNWFWGKAKLNILTLGVCYEGIAIPLFWKLLNKAGNAKASEHQAIIRRFIRVFGKENVVGLLGDREFANGELFKFLNEEHIPFYIRIKDGSNIYIKKRKICSAKKLFNRLSPKAQKVFPMSVWLFGQKVYLSSSRSERGELMVIASNQPSLNAIAIYLRRWEIETLFQSLKNRGFRFEETHLTHPERIKKMMTLLAIGLCWAHKVGEWKASIKPIRLCRHRDCRRPQNSYFRYGMDCIRDLILNPFKKISEFNQTLLLFRPILINTEERL